MTPTTLHNCSGLARSEAARQIENIEAVMREYRPAILRFVLGWLKDRDAAETIVQDCFLRAYRNREQFRGEASLKTWLKRIALNLIRDHARSRRLRFWTRVAACPVDQYMVQRIVPDRQVDPLQRLLAEERDALLRRAIARLPETKRRILRLRYVDGLAFPRISEVTGLAEGIAKRHAYGALETVKLHLNPAKMDDEFSGVRRHSRKGRA